MDSSASSPSVVILPDVPHELAGAPVAAWSEPLTIDSYLPLEPSLYPEFFEYRVYQGSSGRVYPLPFHERIASEKAPHRWQAIHLENRWVRLVILPELGGRIYIAYDKTTDYDFFYRNNVIKPALVGLAGPWVSGGVEFNWPQHHRPATFLPTDWEIENEEDGSVTVWCSDHDPFARMKGMHGIRLRPDGSLVEARVRLYNRTEQTQTFLWWANVAAAVSDDYQSFFPTDVHYVADHARRAVTAFPHSDGRYYGVDYPARVDAEHPDADRLDWYCNIPVPTSYMVLSSEDEFFGGYDHGRKAGFVHVADRTISPGKKQWTWGNAEFGWAWDRNLTDTDGPYVELMAGVYTDNQPDFSFIAPGETKSFSQFWYPISQIGPAHQANRDAALRLDATTSDGATDVTVGVSVTREFPGLEVRVTSADGHALHSVVQDAGPGQPVITGARIPHELAPDELIVTVIHEDRTVLSWRPRKCEEAEAPASAQVPAAPEEITTNEELVLTGQYLEQYRHATRGPVPYWEEALRRDPGDIWANLGLAGTLEKAGRFAESEQHLRAALTRQLKHVANPANGEAFYRLGINLAHQGRDDEATEAFSKAVWNAATRPASHFALAQIAARDGDWGRAEEHARQAIRFDGEHLQAHCVLAVALRRQGRAAEATAVVDAQLRVDPLDQWTRHLAGRSMTSDAPTLLDVALEYGRLGAFAEASGLLDRAAKASARTTLGQVQIAPLVHYHAARFCSMAGDRTTARAQLALARHSDARHCLASRLDDVAALRFAIEEANDARALALLGSWHYDKENYPDAIECWRRAAEGELAPDDAAVVHRNLGIAAFNMLHEWDLAREHFEHARRLRPLDAKLLYEYDQLCARLGEDSATRRERLERSSSLLADRDDLTVTYAELLTTTGAPEQARELLSGRAFQPWEGGEGMVLAAWEHALCAIARKALDVAPLEAVAAMRSALRPPLNLGEARHPLQNAAELEFLLGEALTRAGKPGQAEQAWRKAAAYSGDFSAMSTQPFSDKTSWSILALRSLGDAEAAHDLTDELRRYVDELRRTPATIDYFATSLPALLIFHESPEAARDRLVAVIDGQLARLARG